MRTRLPLPPSATVPACTHPAHVHPLQLATASRLRALGVAHICATLYGFRAVFVQDWVAHSYTVTVA